MGWSLSLGSVAGIRIQLHFTFLIFLAWIVLAGAIQGLSGAAVVVGVTFMLALFGCVVLHEFGHALTARRYGIKTRDITLLPIGGVARLDRMPDDPWEELWVALAGPAVNVVIAGLIWIGLQATGRPFDITAVNLNTGAFLERLLILNVWLVAFNLIPAFPMDGGRVLRALLATRMSFTRATDVAARMGQGFAILFGVIGILYNPLLVFIAFFVWIAATQEAGMTQMKSALSGIPVGAAMITNFETVQPSDPIDHVTQLILSGAQQDFPVTDEDRVVGLVTRSDLLKALARKDTQIVSEIMRRDVAVANPSDMLDGVLQKLQEGACHTLPVVHKGRLVGLLTSENLSEFLMIRSAANSPAERVSVSGNNHQ